MTPFHQDPWLTFYQGDVRDVLGALPDSSVHMVVTSPPYWSLRDYGVDGQLGLEPTPEAYIEAMVAVFREVRRVLRDDGTLWLNMGDSYAADRGGTPMPADTLGGGEGGRMPDGSRAYRDRPEGYSPFRDARAIGLKHKDLIGMPWRLALALQADGWYLRSDIVWAKPNPMPESVTDRPTKAHEYVFLLSKRARYFYDAEAVREPMAVSSIARVSQPTFDTQTGDAKDMPDNLGRYPQRELGEKLASAPDEVRGSASARMGRGAGWRKNGLGASPDPYLDGSSARRTIGLHERWDEREAAGITKPGRNLRDVWTIPSQPYHGAHYAVFPERLVEPCIKAGTSERGVCAECGSPWRRETERRGNLDLSRPQARRAKEIAEAGGLTVEHVAAIRSVGVSDAGKALVTQTGTGRDDQDVQRLADEAKSVLGGYYREFLRTRGETTGWHPTCDHDGEPVPAVVMDIFGGSGTVSLVAERLGRRSVLIELNPEYCGQIMERIAEGRRDGTGPAVDLPLPAPEGSLWESVGRT